MAYMWDSCVYGFSIILNVSLFFLGVYSKE